MTATTAIAKATMTPADAMVRADEDYRKAWEANRLAEALDRVRGSIPGIESRVAAHKEGVKHWEAWLAELNTMRAGFLRELEALPEHSPGPGPDLAAHRRQDLREAVAGLDGGGVIGTILDHLAVAGKPRIPGTQRMIEQTRSLLAGAEAELVRAKQDIAGGEQKLKKLA
jgi:hypothetical protein